jgi:ribosomal protein L37E
MPDNQCTSFLNARLFEPIERRSHIECITHRITCGDWMRFLLKPCPPSYPLYRPPDADNLLRTFEGTQEQLECALASDTKDGWRETLPSQYKGVISQWFDDPHFIDPFYLVPSDQDVPSPPRPRKLRLKDSTGKIKEDNRGKYCPFYPWKHIKKDEPIEDSEDTAISFFHGFKHGSPIFTYSKALADRPQMEKCYTPLHQDDKDYSRKYFHIFKGQGVFHPDWGWGVVREELGSASEAGKTCKVLFFDEEVVVLRSALSQIPYEPPNTIPRITQTGDEYVDVPKPLRYEFLDRTPLSFPPPSHMVPNPTPDLEIADPQLVRSWKSHCDEKISYKQSPYLLIHTNIPSIPRRTAATKSSRVAKYRKNRELILQQRRADYEKGEQLLSDAKNFESIPDDISIHCKQCGSTFFRYTKKTATCYDCGWSRREWNRLDTVMENESEKEQKAATRLRYNFENCEWEIQRIDTASKGTKVTPARHTSLNPKLEMKYNNLTKEQIDAHPDHKKDMNTLAVYSTPPKEVAAQAGMKLSTLYQQTSRERRKLLSLDCLASAGTGEGVLPLR